jgi:fatty-acid desaturase
VQSGEDADERTYGGTLGCLIGSLAGVLIGGFLGTTLLIPWRFVGICLTVGLTFGLAVLGWKIGQRVFREYQPPERQDSPPDV